MGIRPGTKLSDAHRKAIAEGLRRAVDGGWRPNTTTWPAGLAAITPEARQRGAKTDARTAATVTDVTTRRITTGTAIRGAHIV